MCPGKYFLVFVLLSAFLLKPAKENMGVSYSKKRMAKRAVLAAWPEKAVVLALFIPSVETAFFLIVAWQTQKSQPNFRRLQ